MVIFFLIGAVSVPVLKVDPEIFDGLALQLFDNSLVEDFLLLRGSPEFERLRECPRIRSVLFKRLQRDVAQLPGRVGFEDLRAAVDRVDGLTA